MNTSAVELRARCVAREISCTEVVRGFLADVHDDPLRAWAAIEPADLLVQAAALDRSDDATRARLPLFGVPVGIKDNCDTATLPTAYGSSIYARHRPATDAAVVSGLRAAGALIAGKTRCAELAWMTAPETLNPLDSARTPGGSSNGSAAAVAAGLVPVATGTQTAGSIGRPASYCGVLGYKPTFGRLDRTGCKLLADSLDTVGLITREISDLRLVLDALVPPARPRPAGRNGRALRLAFARTPLWGSIEPTAAAAIEDWVQLARAGGLVIDDLELPGYRRLVDAQTTIQSFESACGLAAEWDEHRASLSPALVAALDAGRRIPVRRYEAARLLVARLRPPLVQSLGRYDAVLAPSTTGPPPLGLAFTGDPVFCRVWTLIGAPTLSLPLVWQPDGLPAGLQLVAPPEADETLLETAEELLVRQ